MRIDDPARRESTDQAGDADLAEIRINLDLGEHRAMGVHGIGGLRRRVSGALAAGFDLLQAGAAEDFGITLASHFIVATEQTTAARDHPGIARPEQRRAL